MKLDLTFDEVNQILKQLGQAPFAEVNQLIAKIHAQAIPQMNPVPVEQDKEPTE